MTPFHLLYNVFNLILLKQIVRKSNNEIKIMNQIVYWVNLYNPSVKVF